MTAYIIFGILAVAFLVFVFVNESSQARKKEKNFIKKLYTDYGIIPEREYSEQRYHALTTFYRKHPQNGQIDDITWYDLNLDAIFESMNDTYSSAGEEYLYYSLRTPVKDTEALEHFNQLCEYFRTNPDLRVKLQVLFHKLGRTGKFSIYEYIDHLDLLGKRSNLKHHIANLLMAIAIVVAFMDPSMGLLGVVVIAAYNMISYFKEKNEIDTYITSFAYIIRLLDASEQIGKLNIEVCENELKEINRRRKQFTKFRMGSFWLMSSGRMSGSGNPLDIIFDYLRMTLHLDLIKFNSMLSEVRKHVEDIDVMIQTIGYLESTVAVGAFRESLNGQWCTPQFITERKQETDFYLETTDIYHPLIENPVKNSIRTDKGVLLTGSNASGKSTFLKTVAIGAILSQTIYTCPATLYKADYFHVFSSMALKDDLGGGESYYIVEIKSLKRILDYAKQSDEPVLCFVDEVLRGTNTVERIAASTQILKSLALKNVLCFAATHDIELTSLLENDYYNYHFEETVENGDVLFNYKLLTGKATSRNAIKLLGIMGYDEEIIKRAEKQAADFATQGVWKNA